MSDFALRKSPLVINSGKMWISHGNNIVTFNYPHFVDDYVFISAIQIGDVGGVTTRNNPHSTHSLVLNVSNENRNRAKVRIEGGYGFSNGGTDGTVLSKVERFDDVVNSHTSRTSVTGRRGLGGYSLNGFGFTSCGYNGSSDVGTTERFDDVTNAHTARATATARRYVGGGFTISGYGFIGNGTVQKTERFDDVTNTHTARIDTTGVLYPASYGLNGYGFSNAGTSASVSIGAVNRLDDLANTQTSRAEITARYGAAGYSLSGYGFTSCGFTTFNPGVGTTERADDIANSITSRLDATARYTLSGYSLNGFGMSTCGENGSVYLGTTERFDDIANTHTARASATIRSQIGAYCTNEYFITYISFENRTLRGQKGVQTARFPRRLQGKSWISHGNNVITVSPPNGDFSDQSKFATVATIVRSDSGGVTTRIVPHTLGLNIFTRNNQNYANKITVRIDGGYGFTSAGSSNKTEKFDDVANTHTARTDATSRYFLAGYSLNGFGFTSCGTPDGSSLSAVTERFDDVTNAHTARANATAGYYASGFSLNGYGFVAWAFNTYIFERFDDFANTQTRRRAAGTATYGKSMCTIENVAYIAAGAGAIGFAYIYDDTAVSITTTTPVTDRSYLSGYALNGFGFSSAGYISPNSAGTTEKYDNVTKAVTSRLSIIQTKYGVGAYSLNGFGIVSTGYNSVAGVTGTTDRFDDVANTQTARATATAHYGAAGYSNTDFFINYMVFEG